MDSQNHNKQMIYVDIYDLLVIDLNCSYICSISWSNF